MSIPKTEFLNYLEVVAAPDVLLVDPDLGHRSAVGCKGGHGLPNLGGVGLLKSICEQIAGVRYTGR